MGLCAIRFQRGRVLLLVELDRTVVHRIARGVADVLLLIRISRGWLIVVITTSSEYEVGGDSTGHEQQDDHQGCDQLALLLLFALLAEAPGGMPVVPGAPSAPAGPP